MESFPGNSKSTGASAPAARVEVEQITSAKVSRRKKPLGRKFKDTFFGGDAKTSLKYVAIAVLVPRIKDMFRDSVHDYLDRVMYGETNHRRSSSSRSGGNRYTPHVQYNRITSGGPLAQSSRDISKQARAEHNFDEIVLESRHDAEEVVSRLFDMLSQYDLVTVADLYRLVGLPSTHTDQKWGWEELKGARVGRTNGGFVLDLPDPEPLA